MSGLIKILSEETLDLIPEFTNILHNGIYSIRHLYPPSSQNEINASLNTFSLNSNLKELKTKENGFRYIAHFNEKNQMDGVSIQLTLPDNENPQINFNLIAWIVSKEQSKGIGRKILTHTVEQSKKRNEQYIGLIVSEQNITAINFYEKFGFEKHPIQRADSMIKYWLKI